MSDTLANNLGQTIWGKQSGANDLAAAIRTATERIEELMVEIRRDVDHRRGVPCTGYGDRGLSPSVAAVRTPFGGRSDRRIRDRPGGEDFALMAERVPSFPL
jgi:hypothetical protein